MDVSNLQPKEMMGLTSKDVGCDGDLAGNGHVAPEEAKEQSRDRTLVRPLVASRWVSAVP